VCRSSIRAVGLTGLSLNEFMETASHPYAIRVYSEKLSISKSKTRSGKEFWLLNLPFFLVHKIEEYCRWFIKPLIFSSSEKLYPLSST
jgi:hypothetical protein